MAIQKKWVTQPRPQRRCRVFKPDEDDDDDYYYYDDDDDDDWWLMIDLWLIDDAADDGGGGDDDDTGSFLSFDLQVTRTMEWERVSNTAQLAAIKLTHLAKE